MKRLLFSLLFIAGLSSYSAFSQGTVLFRNVGGNGVTNAFTGNLEVPSANILFALYGGAAGVTNPAALVALGLPATLITDGTFFSGERTNNAVLPGGTGTFQVRAWDSNYGASYEDFLANGLKPADAVNGVSSLFASPTGGGTGPVIAAPTLTATFPGMVLVPEPTTYALGALGLGVVWLARRRRQ